MALSTSLQPDTLLLNELHHLSYYQLLKRSQSLNLSSNHSSFHGLILSQAHHHLHSGGSLSTEGILEFTPNEAVLRWLAFDLKPSIEDVLIPLPMIKKYNLKPGLRLKGMLSVLHSNRLIMHELTEIEGIPIEEWKIPKDFEQLTATFPVKRILLEQPKNTNLTGRVIDLIAPLGMGQRGLIIAPPRAGKTMLLKNIALALCTNYPDIHLIVLLVDERPEEVTDLKRSLKCEIISSTFDEPTNRHLQVSEIVSERSKRLLELGKDVVILIDSLTRLSRGYNNAISTKGKTMSGGIDSRALSKPKRFFGSARNVEEGGSLTILATALIDTQSRMDDLIFEEFKGTGNMEVMLDRSIAEQRIFPAIHLIKSATRREELLYHPEELKRILQLRSQLLELPAGEAIQILIQNIEITNSNTELLLSGLKGI